jgi:hypothetical protein
MRVDGGYCRSLKGQVRWPVLGKAQLGITLCKALIMLRSLVRFQLAPLRDARIRAGSSTEEYRRRRCSAFLW